MFFYMDKKGLFAFFVCGELGVARIVKGDVTDTCVLSTYCWRSTFLVNVVRVVFTQIGWQLSQWFLERFFLVYYRMRPTIVVVVLREICFSLLHDESKLLP
eukprot:TRINITY_DN141498_c0_g1_i1.p5 TRINITY_DN141498_c0_g1~~TRINITY_DN141498_c0_g1_i1.p5  ORF type:complete len:101 (-),score=7.88 TRINITY_DN141498_c0_g1_i1:237-539(-)